MHTRVQVYPVPPLEISWHCVFLLQLLQHYKESVGHSLSLIFPTAVIVFRNHFGCCDYANYNVYYCIVQDYVTRINFEVAI